MGHYRNLMAELSVQVKKFKQDQADAAQAFNGLLKATENTKVVDKKTKELIALAIAVATKCEPCIAFHTKAYIDCGGTLDALMETLAVALYMGGGPALMYAAKTIQAFEELSQAQP